MRISLANRQAQLTALIGRLANAYIRIYSGTRPAGPDTALSGNTLLAELRGAATFGTLANVSTDVVLTLGTVTADASADATGTASFARVLQSDGTTAEFDLSVGTSGAELNLNTLSITSGIQVQITSGTITYPLGT